VSVFNVFVVAVVVAVVFAITLAIIVITALSFCSFQHFVSATEAVCQLTRRCLLSPLKDDDDDAARVISLQ
jgi:hypothetical protein